VSSVVILSRGCPTRITREAATPLPDGQITRIPNFPVHPSREKYSASRSPQITFIISLVSSPSRGAYRDRHGRWDGMRWTRRCRARNRISQGDLYRERFPRVGRTALIRLREGFGETGTRLVERLFRMASRTAKSCGPGTRCWC
jgi:hypothetical protein